ncbi:L-threonylcarbamoyladenylate synthase [Blattabacterium cuenoti]|uniref:L-threonylcarbamoyladenylate synthase n=1 Tax=Blattabacterium cuenoti TaxID=1653831 RepID=UPI00163D0FE1|nr:Sua5/YciO/YrdC/YwlC family protein [Blattabacterium cuenoti]
MSFYKKEVNKSIYFLKIGKILLYPTDTIWGIGCDAFNEKSVQKIYTIKNRDPNKSMILLVESIDRLCGLVGEISDFTRNMISYNHIRYKKKPITIIYEIKKNIKYNFLIRNHSLAIRLTHDPFCKLLIKNLNRPIISTSANLSGSTSPQSFNDINPCILNKIDYAVNLKRKEKSLYNHSMIMKIQSNQIKILRM